MPAAKTAKAKSAATRSSKPEFAPVFAALRKLLESYRGNLAVQTDQPGNYHLEAPFILHRGKPLYFAGVKTGKSYVSFHLIAAYFNPAMKKAISPALRKRMQGKACFNFTAIDEACFAELDRLIAESLKIFKSEKFRQDIQRLQ
jgi:hypothetical protein